MIRIDEIWLSTQPLDMRAGMDTFTFNIGYKVWLSYVYPTLV